MVTPIDRCGYRDHAGSTARERHVQFSRDIGIAARERGHKTAVVLTEDSQVRCQQQRLIIVDGDGSATSFVTVRSGGDGYGLRSVQKRVVDNGGHNGNRCSTCRNRNVRWHN